MDQIVVGIDGSAEAARALRWAVAEGIVRGAPVQALMAWGRLDQRRAGATTPLLPDGDEEDARRAADAAVAAVALAADAPPVQVDVRAALPWQALAEASEDAALLVVGARGLGGFKGLLLGSVSDRVLRESACPVVVVPGAERPTTLRREDDRIVVGTDGSPESCAAVRWAAHEAALHKGHLVLVHAWTPPFVASPGLSTPVLDTGGHDAAQALLERVAADEVPDDVPVELVLQGGSPSWALVDAARSAALLVVGGRPPSGVGRILGSVARQVIHHATCPVAVVPDA